METIVFIFIVTCLYFLPAIIAKSKHRRNTGAVFALNLLLGWTVLGWIVALVWALTDGEK